MRILTMIFLLFSAPVWAQISLPKYTQLNSNLGPVTVQAAQVYVGGNLIPGMASATVHLHGIYNHSGDGSQTVLLSMRHGGNGCFDDWAIIRILANQIVPSAPFGGCSDTLIALRADAFGLELDMPDMNPSYSHMAYRFDGTQFTVARVLKTAAPSGGVPPFDVNRWLGTQVYDIYRDDIERSRFLMVMPQSDLDALINQTSLSAAMFSDGAYLYGNGCMAHQCNTTGAAFAIHIATGQPYAVFYGAKGQRQSVGGILPPRLQRFYNTGVFEGDR